MYTVQQPDPDYVVRVFWTLTGVDEQISVSQSGSLDFLQNQEQSGFVPYSELTETMVIGWVETALGENSISNYENSIQEQIDFLNNPTSVPEYTPLPWAAQ
jgi:hypothetical protein